MGFAPFRRGDFVLLTDDVQCKLIRFEEIFFLQAYRNYTLVYFSGGKLWVRTALKDCESRLDRSTFFSRQPRLSCQSYAGQNPALTREWSPALCSRRRKRGRAFAPADHRFSGQIRTAVRATATGQAPTDRALAPRPGPVSGRDMASALRVSVGGNYCRDASAIKDQAKAGFANAHVFSRGAKQVSEIPKQRSTLGAACAARSSRRAAALFAGSKLCGAEDAARRLHLMITSL